MPKKEQNSRKSEQKFCTDLIKWLKHNIKHPCYIEAKVAYDDKPFNFKSGFRPHQLKVLMNAKTKPFGYKLGDQDRLIKPFDIIASNKIDTYVAIMWVRHGNKRFYLIDPVDIQKLIDSDHKSMDEGMAMVIAHTTGELR